MKKDCPICGAVALVEKSGEFRFEPPANIPGGTIILANSTWEECEVCHEVILLPELIERLEQQRYVRLGLLSPSEIKAIRIKAGLTQTEISEILGVGEKTYTRWENGKSLQNKSSDNLIRIFSNDPSSLKEIETQRESAGCDLLKGYYNNLNTSSTWNEKTPCNPRKGSTGKNKYSLAA